jgi:hypothetical protein
MRTAIICGTLVLAITTASAAEKLYPYPGDDWQLYKPGATDERMGHDYADCLSSPSAPPMFDSRLRITTNPKAIETHRRFVLSCMGTKGYVLVPPSAKP